MEDLDPSVAFNNKLRNTHEVYYLFMIDHPKIIHVAQTDTAGI